MYGLFLDPFSKLMSMLFMSLFPNLSKNFSTSSHVFTKKYANFPAEAVLLRETTMDSSSNALNTKCIYIKGLTVT